MSCIVEDRVKDSGIDHLIGLIKERLVDFNPSKLSLSEMFSSISKIVNSKNFDSLRNSREAQDVIDRELGWLRNVYFNYYLVLESLASFRIISLDDDPWQAFTSNNSALLFSEAELTGINESSMVAFVGSGIMPWSALRLCSDFKCKVICVERDLGALNTASKVVSKLGLEGNIELVQSEGSTFDYSRCSHVMIAAMVDSKNAVLQRVLDTSAGGIQILVRSAKPLNQVFYARFDMESNGKITKSAVARGDGAGELESILFVRKR